MPTRPTSVTVFGILNIAFGAFGIFGLLIGLVFINASHAKNPVLEFADQNVIYGLWYRWGTALRGLFSLVLVASGIGLLRMKPWARTAAIVYAVYGILAGIAASVISALVMVPGMERMAEGAAAPQATILKYAAYGSIAGGCFSMIYPLLVLIFMMRRNVVAAFRPALPPPVPTV